MNYLQICQRINQECGLSGSGPAAVTAQAGMSAKVVNWANSAWQEIQTSRTDWKWRRSSATKTLVNGEFSYSIEDDFGISDCDSIFRDSVRLYGPTETIANRTKVMETSYQDWIDSYEQNVAATGRPTLYAITPADEMNFSVTPDGAYTLLFDYLRTAQVLASNTDEPLMPAQYHMAIVWRAVMMYGAHDESPLYQTAYTEYKKLLRSMTASQVMSIVMAGGLI